MNLSHLWTCTFSKSIKVLANSVNCQWQKVCLLQLMVIDITWLLRQMLFGFWLLSGGRKGEKIWLDLLGVSFKSVYYYDDYLEIWHRDSPTNDFMLLTIEKETFLKSCLPTHTRRNVFLGVFLAIDELLLRKNNSPFPPFYDPYRALTVNEIRAILFYMFFWLDYSV